MNYPRLKKELFNIIDQVLGAHDDDLIALIAQIEPSVRLSEDSKKRRDDLLGIVMKTEIEKYLDVSAANEQNPR